MAKTNGRFYTMSRMIQFKYLGRTGAHLFFVCVISIHMWACGSEGEKQKEMLQQAYGLHLKSIQIRHTLNEWLTKSKEHALTDSLYNQDLDSITQLLEIWDTQVVEVPGFEKEHHHEHDHHVQPQLTPQQHIQIQQHLLNEIREIAKRVNRLQ